ncbi:Ku protein [Streptomyces sp. NPDC048639]|uniref:Ku protein n=1 Tax=Streptomyces sp. NPDC048639 TaxID=3365581 RepID=UPI0037200E61
MSWWSPTSLDELAPGRSQAVEITGFACLEDIEPGHFDATYHVQPRSEGDANVYALMRDALEDSGRAGIATMTMRQKGYLVAVHAEGGIVVVHTLHWADEVRGPHEVSVLRSNARWPSSIVVVTGGPGHRHDRHRLPAAGRRVQSTRRQPTPAVPVRHTHATTAQTVGEDFRGLTAHTGPLPRGCPAPRPRPALPGAGTSRPGASRRLGTARRCPGSPARPRAAQPRKA